MQNKKLKITLIANALFSALSGLTMSYFHMSLAMWMGIAQPKILIFIGLGLLLFSISLYRTAQSNFTSTKQVKVIIWQDWLWVIGSAIIILTQSFGLNTVGYVAIGIVAIIVADFAILQAWFLKKASF